MNGYWRAHNWWEENQFIQTSFPISFTWLPSISCDPTQRQSLNVSSKSLTRTIWSSQYSKLKIFQFNQKLREIIRFISCSSNRQTKKWVGKKNSLTNFSKLMILNEKKFFLIDKWFSSLTSIFGEIWHWLTNICRQIIINKNTTRFYWSNFLGTNFHVSVRLMRKFFAKSIFPGNFKTPLN